MQLRLKRFPFSFVSPLEIFQPLGKGKKISFSSQNLK